MRKLLLLAVSLLLTVTTIFAERVSQADAALVAKNFMSAPAVQTGVKKAVPTEMVLKKAASAEENQYYVYENANGEGWVMVAANDIAHPILAYSTTGQFRTDNQPMNLKVWLGGYDRQIKRAAADGVEASESIKQEWEKLRQSPIVKTATPVVSPLIKTGWDQDAPFWNFCPTKSGSQCYTGCVATAMAQVMNYWQWPKKGTGSHTDKYYTSESADFGSTTYEWANMLNTYGSGATSAQKTAVATLMYHCGIACDMQYGTADEGGSAAWTIDYNGYWSNQGIMCAEKALTQFFGYNSETVTGYCRDGDSSTGMKSWTKAEWIAMLKAELDAKRPIMYAGVGYEDPSDPESGYGHSFVCDGYDNANYFHFNFGWTNWCDGYYDIDALETTDPGSGGGNGSYSLEQDVIVGIMPPGEDRNVTWMAKGSEFATTVASAGVISLPTSSPTACDNGKVFVGWTATENYESATTAPTYVKEGDIIEADATYYAVFATKSETGGTSIEKATSIAVGDKVILVYETDSKELSGISSTSTKYGLGQDYTDTPTGVFPLDVVQGKTTGTFALMNGSNYLSWTSGNSLTTTGSLTDNSSWNITISSGDAVIKNSSDETRSIRWNSSNPRFACYTSGQNAVQLYKIGSGASYQDYSLNCGTVEPCVLTAISLNTDNVKKTFTVGETFNSTGLVVTAAYSNCSDKTVTPTSVTTPDLTAAGNKTVTVSYTENGTTQTATYQISVTEPVKYNVTWSVNGVPGTPVQYTEGEALILPTTPSDCSETQVFVGWTANSSISGEPEDLFTTASGNVNANATYYAVFATKSTTTGGSSTPTKATSIAAGDKVVFVCEGVSKELTGFSSASTVYGVGTAYETTPEGTMVFDVEAGSSTGTFAFKNGNNYVNWSSGNSLNTATTKNANTSWTVSISNGNATIANASDATRVIWWNVSNPRFACYTGKSAGTSYYAIQLYKVTASSTTTYSNYTLSCEEIVPCALTGITLNTEGVQTTFTVGDAFNSTGLVVTAAYSNCDSKNVTATVTAPDMTTAGTKQVTVSYTENEVTKTASYNITVNELPVVNTYTVTWHACDGNKVVTYNEGDPLVLPATPAANAGKAFYGWTTTEHYTGATAPAIISAGGAVNADADYYAVYK